MISIKQIKSDTSGSILYNGTTSIESSSDFIWDDTNKELQIEGDIVLLNTSNVNKLHIRAGVTANDIEYVMPITNPTAGQVLTASVPVANISTLSWTSPGGAVATVSGTTNRITSTGGANPVIDIDTNYVGQSSITTLGTITTGIWQGTSISTVYTDAKIETVTGTTNRLIITGTTTDPIFDIDANYVGQSSITTIGTITTGVWNGTTIDAIYGGTGQSSYAVGDILYASSASVLSKLNIGINGQVLTITSGVPTWETPTDGTVTSVSVVTANGFAGTVATDTTTPAITLTTSITGVLKGSSSALVAATDSDITAFLLTGLSIVGNSITATDTILEAFGKIQNQINGLLGGVIYQGTWNATTNTPTLADGIGTKGYYYVVSVAGSTNIDGITDWNIGDWIIFNGTVWEKVDNTDAVISVNGNTGAVALTGTTDRITISGANVFDIAATYIGQTSITTLGTIITGVWNGTAIANANLANSTITINGSSTSLGGSVTITTTGTADRITITDGGGLTPTVDIASTYVGQSSITTLGTITTGTWNGTILGPTYGGTGINNGSFTITLGGNLTTSGAFDTTLTVTGTTNVTLPTTGTLATLAGTENLTNKTLDNTNTVTLLDTLFTLQDDGDTTKQLQFELSDITTATTRILTAPDADGVISIRDNVYKNTVQTTNNTATTITTIPTVSNTGYLVETRIVSRRVSGTGAGANGDSGAYIRTALIKNVGGTVTIVTIQSTFTAEDIAAHNVTITNSGTDILINVIGTNNNTVDWKAITEIVLI